MCIHLRTEEIEEVHNTIQFRIVHLPTWYLKISILQYIKNLSLPVALFVCGTSSPTLQNYVLWIIFGPKWG
jgi:hypothetical protein